LRVHVVFPAAAIAASLFYRGLGRLGQRYLYPDLERGKVFFLLLGLMAAASSPAPAAAETRFRSRPAA
jgi:hypothetical protein